MLHSNRNTMMVDKTCCVVAFSVGLILLLSGRCLGFNLPQVDFTAFEYDGDCVVDQVTIMHSTFTLNLTGADRSLFLDSVSISDETSNELARTKFSTCPSVEDLKMLCLSEDGDIYKLQYSFKAGREFSGVVYWASILYNDFERNVTSPYTHRYPFVKYAPIQTLVIESDDWDSTKNFSKEWYYQTDPEYTVDNRPDDFNLTYRVKGLELVTHSISILDKDKNVVSTSISDYTITATLPGTTKTFYVQYTSDHCETNSRVTIKGNVTDAGLADWWIILLIVVAFIVIAAIIAVFVYKRYLKPLTVEIKTDSSLNDLEVCVILLLSEKDRNKTVHFFHTDKDIAKESEKTDKNGTMIRDLMPTAERSGGGEEVVVVMRVKADKEAVNITIKDIKKKPADKDVEMVPPKAGSFVGTPEKPDQKPLPEISAHNNEVRKMRKKDKGNNNKSSSQTALVSSDQFDQPDGGGKATTKMNGGGGGGSNGNGNGFMDGRHSPGRPFNDTRIHPEAQAPSPHTLYYTDNNGSGVESLGGSGGSRGRGGGGGDFNVSTSGTAPLPISTNFPTTTDSVSSMSHSHSSGPPRQLPPLRSKLPPLDATPRPLPSPKSTPL